MYRTRSILFVFGRTTVAQNQIPGAPNSSTASTSTYSESYRWSIFSSTVLLRYNDSTANIAFLIPYHRYGATGTIKNWLAVSELPAEPTILPRTIRHRIIPYRYMDNWKIIYRISFFCLLLFFQKAPYLSLRALQYFSTKRDTVRWWRVILGDSSPRM